jgi:hypothetical protein
LEDSVPYSPSEFVDPTYSFLKFVDNSDTYSLHGRVVYQVPPLTLTGAASFEYSSGEILLDYMRASSINWSFASALSISVNGAYFGVKLYYEIYDIAGTQINFGSLWEERIGPSWQRTIYVFHVQVLFLPFLTSMKNT